MGHQPRRTPRAVLQEEVSFLTSPPERKHVVPLLTARAEDGVGQQPHIKDVKMIYVLQSVAGLYILEKILFRLKQG